MSNTNQGISVGPLNSATRSVRATHTDWAESYIPAAGQGDIECHIVSITISIALCLAANDILNGCRGRQDPTPELQSAVAGGDKSFPVRIGN